MARRTNNGGLSDRSIIILIGVVFAIIVFIGAFLQFRAERGAFSLDKINPQDTVAKKDQYEIYKLAAEIRQIRSDTSGSLFWLKLVGLFVTVGGAVGGYLLGQHRVNKSKMGWEQRKNIDAGYQTIVSELSHEKPVLRAAAAVKLGTIIYDYPSEWNLSDDEDKNNKRREELSQLTKNVLATALSTEEDRKVLKALSIALVPKSNPLRASTEVNLSYLDFSYANAQDAYWAKVDFTGSDFFGAHLKSCSFRGCKLIGTSFYNADLSKSVLRNSICNNAYFTNAKLKGADLRDADLRQANFSGAIFDEYTNFAGAHMYGATMSDVNFDDLKDAQVNVSDNDIAQMVSLKDWLLGQRTYT